MSVLIVSIADDLHALSIQAELRNRKIDCDILECDTLGASDSITFSVGSGSGDAPAARFLTSEGIVKTPSEYSLVWWRRFRTPQQSSEEVAESAHSSLINNDCATALAGSLMATFEGVWISPPAATEIASNKLHQLAIADRSGLRIPDTIVTQCPNRLREFYDKHGGNVIVKPVAGTPGPLLFTQIVSRDHLDEEESIRACPAIYQERLAGTRHLRINIFGRNIYSFLIESDDLDWRPNLNVPISFHELPKDTGVTLLNVLDRLSLRMGVIDMKITDEGEICWLEVNPQGQFLFLEGLTQYPLTERFVDFICENL